MSQAGTEPRRVAYEMLNQVMVEGQLMSELLRGEAFLRLPFDERARAQRLAVETLRGLGRIDQMLARELKKAPPILVRNALRLGMYELCHGEAAHGVVNAYVALMHGRKKTESFKGLVNAVLRKMSDVAAKEWGKQPVPQLPKWLRRPLMEAWGQAAIGGIERAHFAGAPLDLSVKADAQGVARDVGGVVLPTGTVRVTNAGQVSKLSGYEGGKWWVQDAAAALPVKVLAPQNGAKVLDLCAAPGGKTMQLAALGADVTAVDVSAPRLARLEENLQRVGLEATTMACDAFSITQGEFDAIVLDAPCSATGTIRRHPDLPYAKDGSEFSGLIDLQEQMIDHAITLLKPGGTLLYCTCSLLPDEGEVQVETALERHAHLSVKSELYEQPWIEANWLTREGGLRIRPDYWAEHGGMDGFYIAALQVS